MFDSKPTPESSAKGHGSAELKCTVDPYQIPKPLAISFSTKLAQVFSTPNLRAKESGEKDRKLRHSHSASSMEVPKLSTIAPLRLHSLTNNENEETPWSEVIHESLRLSQFPVPPRPSLHSAETTSDLTQNTKTSDKEKLYPEQLHQSDESNTESTPILSQTQTIEIRIQQPTSTVTPRASTSVRGIVSENSPPIGNDTAEDVEEEDTDSDHRRSVHLYSMRISHHLRSGSLLSWDQLADAADLPNASHVFRERAVSDQSRNFRTERQVARHERQTSSSGFASSKVPSRWGKVLVNDAELRGDVASSIYSSRPQSPPGSFPGSMINLSQTGTVRHDFSPSSIDLKKLRRSVSLHTDNELTPRPTQKYIARKNSVAETKKSKFREEFSPSPPRKRLSPSASFMKFFNPKRLSLRSQSEANLQSAASDTAVDGHFDALPLPDRERRQSCSLLSLQTEQESLDRNPGADHVWEKALKAHQDEKLSMFRPKNKERALQASPFRKRSGSVTNRRLGVQDAESPSDNSAPPLEPHTPETAAEAHQKMPRRSAMKGNGESSTIQVAEAFESQGDSPTVVGAWGSYPSHTRNGRVSSAGKQDRVEIRDFALEAAIRRVPEISRDYEEDLIDPMERNPSPPLLPGEKKRKKKIGTSKMAKSHSMTFGRKLIKSYYTDIFKSSSMEYRRHGHGHRSSVTSGGNLAQPELELLPEVFMSGATDGATDRRIGDGHVRRWQSERHNDPKKESRLPEGDSMATLRRRRNSSAPNLKDIHNSVYGSDSQDRARVWSQYYENCIPSYPRLSGEAEAVITSRHSLDSRRSSVNPRAGPSHTMKHYRNASQFSRVSNLSRGSGRHSILSMDNDQDGDEKSLVSVRRSTMDLISKFKQQEVTERERVLSLTKAESKEQS